jgi:hypothetical protein
MLSRSPTESLATDNGLSAATRLPTYISSACTGDSDPASMRHRAPIQRSRRTTIECSRDPRFRKHSPSRRGTRNEGGCTSTRGGPNPSGAVAGMSGIDGTCSVRAASSVNRQDVSRRRRSRARSARLTHDVLGYRARPHTHFGARPAAYRYPRLMHSIAVAGHQRMPPRQSVPVGDPLVCTGIRQP